MWLCAVCMVFFQVIQVKSPVLHGRKTGLLVFDIFMGVMRNFRSYHQD